MSIIAGTMHEDVKTEWVKALRSGDYRQGRRVLSTLNYYGVGTFHQKEDVDEYCCLGVLCDLAINAGVNRSWDDIVDGETDGFSYLPNWVMEWAGLGTPDPGGIDMGEHEYQINTLAGWNDEGKSFNQIAAAIEIQL